MRGKCVCVHPLKSQNQEADWVEADWVEPVQEWVAFKETEMLPHHWVHASVVSS